MASHSDKQLPARSDFVYYGAHGYDPDVQDMKGIFFAKGPGRQINVLFNFACRLRNIFDSVENNTFIDLNDVHEVFTLIGNFIARSVLERRNIILCGM